MFSSGPNYIKLKTNLRLCINRLKLLEKKKAELAQKTRKEIADLIGSGKVDRARIRVEHIIREDYLVEAMEVVEMYCDMLLARYGLITQLKVLEENIAEPIHSIVWVCPRLESDVPELKIISEIFIKKYGPEFAEQARTATGEHHVSQKLMHKLQLAAPPKLLVENYLIEIAKNYNIEYEPDPQVMKAANENDQAYLIDLSDRNNLGGGGGAGGGSAGGPPPMGFIGYPQMPELPMPMPQANKPFNYPPPKGGNSGGGGGGGAAAAPGPFTYNIPPQAWGEEKPQPTTKANPNEDKDLNTSFLDHESNDLSSNAASNAAQISDSGSPDENALSQKYDDPPPRYSSLPIYNNLQQYDKPKPKPRTKMGPQDLDDYNSFPLAPGADPNSLKKNPSPTAPPPHYPDITNLPNVPNDLPDIPSDDKPDNKDDEIDFDALSRRFENLKKKK